MGLNELSYRQARDYPQYYIGNYDIIINIHYTLNIFVKTSQMDIF